jgi:peptidoglycan/LPS O-acetylase OafA/YrhL
MQKHVHGLDLMRAVAIAMVVFQHGALFFYLCYGSAAIWTKVGEIGVTLFFALSGFLIGGILLDLGGALADSRTASQFWLRRALRTLPNYFLFIGLNVAYWHTFQRARGYPSPYPLLPRYAVFLQNFSSRPNWFFPESWSLSVEEWFYLMFPLGLYLGLRVLKAPFGRLFWGLASLMVILPAVLRGLTLSPEDWANGITRVVIYRPDSVAIGLLAVALCRRFPAAWARVRLPSLVLGAATLAGSFLYMGYGDPAHSGPARVLLPLAVNLGSALLLPWASTCMSLGSPALNVPVRAVARWSYSMYLVNLMLSGTVLSHMQFHYGTWVGIVSYASACILASAAIYHGFEAPILRWRDAHVRLGRGPGRRARAPSAAG